MSNLFHVRRATEADAEQLGRAHLDAIRTIGARHYDRDIVEGWGARIRPEMHTAGMARGELFFVALDPAATREGLGFSSTHAEDRPC